MYSVAGSRLEDKGDRGGSTSLKNKPVTFPPEIRKGSVPVKITYLLGIAIVVRSLLIDASIGITKGDGGIKLCTAHF